MERFSTQKVVWFYLSVLLLIPIFTAGCAHSEPLTLKSGETIRVAFRVDAKAPFHVGDTIPVVLTIETKKGYSCQIPELDEKTSGGLELKVKQSLKTETFSEGTRQTILYPMAGWHVGTYAVPAITLNYQTSTGRRYTYATTPLTITLSSVLPKGISGEELLTFTIKGSRLPLGLQPRYSLFKWFLLGATIAICLGLLFYFYRRSLLQNGIAGKTIIKPAHEIALKRLAKLKELTLESQENFKTFYSELSECIREYIENRYAIHALEMTTEEFLKRLTTGPFLNTQQQSLLKDFMQQSDLVKFAGFLPSGKEAKNALFHIQELVQATQEQPIESDSTDQPIQTTL